MKRRLLGLLILVLLCAGFGLVVDGDKITTLADAFWAALRFVVIAGALRLGQALAARAGMRQKESSPRAYQVVAWLLAALPVVSLAWLLIETDASGWRRLGLVLVMVGALALTFFTARAGLLTGRFQPEQQRPGAV